MIMIFAGAMNRCYVYVGVDNAKCVAGIALKK
jgi:hypothetical protein